MYKSRKEKECELLSLRNIFLVHNFFFRPCAIVRKSEPVKGYLARVKIVRPRRFGQVWGAHLALERGRPQAWKEIVTS
jgi:hypothetical protein